MLMPPGRKKEIELSSKMRTADFRIV